MSKSLEEILAHINKLMRQAVEENRLEWRDMAKGHQAKICCPMSSPDPIEPGPSLCDNVPS